MSKNIEYEQAKTILTLAGQNFHVNTGFLNRHIQSNYLEIRFIWKV